MAIGSEQGRQDRRLRIEQQFAAHNVEAALDLLHLTDMAWHDCYGPHELEIPSAVLDDVLLLASGNLASLVTVARAAVLDFRDVRVAADFDSATRHRGKVQQVWPNSMTAGVGSRRIVSRTSRAAAYARAANSRSGPTWPAA